MPDFCGCSGQMHTNDLSTPNVAHGKCASNEAFAEISGTISEEGLRWIINLYVECGFSTYRIAKIVQMDRQRVARILKQEGIEIAPQGAGRRRPLRVPNVVSDAILYDLYVTNTLTSTDIGRSIGVSDRLVRSRLARAGIARRSRGKWERKDRTDVNTEELSRLYLEQELSAQAVGEELGVSRCIVLRSAHTHGLPVRAGGAPLTHTDFNIHLIKALYDDACVARVLDVNAVPTVREPGPIWQRFPIPVPLTRELATMLYCECGLSAFHIEILTGNPVPTVLRRLDRLGIPTRGQGGRSPFRQRWHDQQRLNGELK